MRILDAQMMHPKLYTPCLKRQPITLHLQIILDNPQQWYRDVIEHQKMIQATKLFLSKHAQSQMALEQH